MDEAPLNQRGSAPACRWRTSGETLDLIEALERIEALLLRLDERMRQAEVRESASEVRGDPVRDGGLR
jgi:hypothetical protein